MKKYKIKAPLGTEVIPNEVMTEKEIRQFMPQLIGEADQAETWREKAQKDSIDEVVGWLRQAGYEIEELKK